MDQLEQDIINAANIKLAGLAKGVALNLLGGAASGGSLGAGLGSAVGGGIGAVKGYRNATGTLGDKIKASLYGGLKGGTKGGLIGGGLGAGIGAGSNLMFGEADARNIAHNALMHHLAAKEGVNLNHSMTRGTKYVLDKLQGLNSGSASPNLVENALGKAREYMTYGGGPDASALDIFAHGFHGPIESLLALRKMPGSLVQHVMDAYTKPIL